MSYGYEDKPLISDPEITFFKIVYHTHSLFSVQEHEIQSETDITFGNSTVFKIRNYGDLIYNPILQVELPEIEVLYDDTIDNYLLQLSRTNSRLLNSNANLIISKLTAMLYNYNIDKFPIFIQNNLLINNTYGTINSTTIETNYKTVYDESYNSFFGLDLSANNFEKYINSLQLYNSPNNKINTNIYYSTYNINYLTTILNNIVLSDSLIVTKNDFFQNFKTNLYNFITSNNYELQFLNSIINNTNIIGNNFSTKNVQDIVSNQIEYSLQYFYSNMSIFYVYGDVPNSTNKQLKAIFNVNNYNYSSSNYTVNVYPFINLYDVLDNDISNNLSQKYYIATGYLNNKKFNISTITSIDISNNSYIITSDLFNNGIDPNICYRIFPDILPRDQDILNITNSNTPSSEDFLKLYYQNQSETTSNLFDDGNEKRLTPLCVVQYNTITKLFDKINLTNNITSDDYIMMFKDIFIFNELSQKIQYVIINEELYDVNDTSGNNIIYSDRIFISNPTPIINSTITKNNNLSYFLNSTNSELQFIDNYSLNTFSTQEFVSPFYIPLIISNTDFYYKRLKSIDFVKNTTLDLDTFTNTNFISSQITSLNLSTNAKNAIIINNISTTLEDNILYITNIFESFLNDTIFFKLWNPFVFSTAASSITFTISPSFSSNFYSKIFTKINGTNNYYNSLQNIITTNMNVFIDSLEIEYLNVIRYFYNLNYSNQTSLLHALNNSQNITNYISIINTNLTDLINGSATIFFQLNTNFIPGNNLFGIYNDPITYFNDVFNITVKLDPSTSYYYISDINLVLNTTSTTTDTSLNTITGIYLISSNNEVNQQFYFFMYLLNLLPDINNNYIITEFYISNTITINLSNKITINNSLQNIFCYYDSITPVNISHYQINNFNNITTTLNSNIDIIYILYHYAFNLYISVKDRINLFNQSNDFMIFNDIQNYNNVWSIHQSLAKIYVNASANIINLTNIGNSSYLSCSTCFSNYFDHISINNSLIENINIYFNKYLRPLLVTILDSHINYFNLFNIAYTFNINNKVNTNISSLDIGLEDMPFFQVFLWYLHYLNSIISDIDSYVINYQSNNIFNNLTLNSFQTIYTFFNSQSNIFDSNIHYLGSFYNLTYENYLNIISANTIFNNVVNYIIALTQNIPITLDDNSINIYTETYISTIYKNVLFNSLNIHEFIYGLPIYYANNFYNNYQYNYLLTFFNSTKKSYINTYDLLINLMTQNGSYSSMIISELTQYIYFNITDYTKQMNYFRINPDYNPANDIYLNTNIITNIPLTQFDDYYKYTIITAPNKDLSSSFINKFYNVYSAINTKQINTFNIANNALQLLFVSVDDIINAFRTYYNVPFSFYSDYTLIVAFYQYLFSRYSFINVIEAQTYYMYFDYQNNSSSNNYITNSDGTKKYPYLNTSFGNNNIINYIIKNNTLFDINNNKYINYDFLINLTPNTIIYSAYTYSFDNPYNIINNLIYDMSNNLLYKIINNQIIDLFSNSVGSISNNIYDISNNGITTKYKYFINNNKQQILYRNYSPIPIQNNSIIINNISYNIYNNKFYDPSNNLIKFYIFLDNITPPYINLYDINNEINTIIPDTIRYSILNNDNNLASDFQKILIESFSPILYTKSIVYIHNGILRFCNPGTNPNLLVQLLNNITKNSIIPPSYLYDDILICSSFNNYIKSNNFTSSNITNFMDILLWLINYNLTNINLIYIFNQTDQIFITINDFIISNLLNKTFYFVPNRITYIPILPEIILSNKFLNSITSVFTYMLNQKKLINSDDLIYLNHLGVASQLIKDAMLNIIFNDIGNYTITSFLYTQYIIFTINNNNVIINNLINLSNIDLADIPNSYLIRNSTIISLPEFNYINSIGNLSYVGNYFLLNNRYLITTNNTYTDHPYDISLNSIFDHNLNTVHINIYGSLFPRTLYIFNGQIYRNNLMDFGYEIDISGNLKYTLSYDLSMNILDSAISKFNNALNNNYIINFLSPIIDNTITYYVNEQIIIDVLSNYTNFVTNYLGNPSDKLLWDETDVLVSETDIYIAINKNLLHSTLTKEYIIINNNLFHIVTILDITNYKLLKVQSLDGFIYDSRTTYTLKLGIKNIINYIGSEKMNDRVVFNYWETFLYSIQEIIKNILPLDDYYFVNQQFTLNSYIDKIYEIINNNIANNNTFLFNIPDELFQKKTIYNINNFINGQTIQSYISSTISLYNNVMNNINNIQSIINRDTIPKCSWIPYIGHYLIDKINFKIDDNIIEEMDGQILQIYNKMNVNNITRDRGLNIMIGNIPDLTLLQNKINKKTLYIPLPFFFSSTDKALPLIALMYSKLTISLFLQNLENLINKPILSTIKLKSKLKVKLLSSYVYLDDSERRKFAEMRHEYLIDIKKNYKYYINSNIGSLKLDLAVPVKDMMWFYLDNNIISKNDYWNYTGISYKEYNKDNPIFNDFNINDDVYNYIMILLNRHQLILNHYNNNNLLTIKNINVLDTTDLIQLKNYLNNRPIINNPFINSELMFNGHSRFSVEGMSSGLITSLNYYNDTFQNGLNIYNYCRYPKLNTHSGSLNFKFANNINFNYELGLDNIDGEINIIIRSYNVLRIASGIGCLSW